MSGKGYHARLVIIALAGLFLAVPAWAKDKEAKDYKEKELKDAKDKYSKNDYPSKGDSSQNNSKDYRSAMIAPGGSPNSAVPQKPVKLSGSERTLLHIHDVLAPADDEWQVLRPRIEKIVTLQREAGARRDPKGPRPPSSKELARMAESKSSSSSSSSTPSPVSDSAKALNLTLADQAARLQDLRQRVAAARDARARVKTELARTQEDLRGLLTVRQEAALIVMGLLD